MGPTASGKTALALWLCERFPFEVISVDSSQVYRGMDIGTAKPSAEECARVPHRLIDIRDPSQPYSAAQFREDALRELAQITRRGRIPLLVGGTMFYFRALERGLSPLPAADPDVRAALQREGEGRGWPVLHGRLAGIDPAYAARIDPHDAQRIQRALEIYELTHTPPSLVSRADMAKEIPYRVTKIAVTPSDRRVLHERVRTRFCAMLEQGLVEEAARLFARGDLSPELPSMRTVGYRQVGRYLAGELEYSEMIKHGIYATRQLAKRQLTWLRRQAGLIWFDSAREDCHDTVGVFFSNVMSDMGL